MEDGSQPPVDTFVLFQYNVHVFYYLYLSLTYVEQVSMVYGFCHSIQYLCCEEALLVFVPMTVMYVSLCMHVVCALYDILLSKI